VTALIAMMISKGQAQMTSSSVVEWLNSGS